MKSRKKDLQSGYKLMKHPVKLQKWIDGEEMHPLHIHFELTDICNNKCPLCTTGSRGKSSATMDYEKAREVILQLKDSDSKGIIISGGGDPACHPNFSSIIDFIKGNGIDVGINTNGLGLSESNIESIAQNGTWVRVSLDADGPRIYKRTHGMEQKAFNRVLGNIKGLVSAKKRLKSNLDIGICYLIDGFTVGGAYNATKIVKDLGADYMRLRPFFQFEKKERSEKEKKEITKELERCKSLEDENFSVSFPKDRLESIVKKGKEREHKKCYVHNFMTAITPDFKVYPCCLLTNQPKYCLGDLNKNTFREIWSSEQRKEAYERINFEDCPYPCMAEKHNELLWSIKHNDIVGEINLKGIIGSTNKEIKHSNFL